MPNTFIERVQSVYSELSKAKQDVARYLVDHWRDACFLPAAKLGNEVGVSESVVIRLAQDLGYSGYLELQSELREFMNSHLTLSGRLEKTLSQSEPADLVERVLETDVANLHAVATDNPLPALLKAVDMMAEARNIGVISYGPTTSLSVYLAINLDQILVNCQHLSLGMGDWLGRTRHYGSGDLLIAISFPRYHSSVYNMLELGISRGAVGIAITDSMLAPIATIAHHTLTVKTDGVSFHRTLSAGATLINMLLALLATREKDRVRSSLADLDSLLRRY